VFKRFFRRHDPQLLAVCPYKADLTIDYFLIDLVDLVCYVATTPLYISLRLYTSSA
jgi:hypothetical protein